MRQTKKLSVAKLLFVLYAEKSLRKNNIHKRSVALNAKTSITIVRVIDIMTAIMICIM